MKDESRPLADPAGIEKNPLGKAGGTYRVTVAAEPTFGAKFKVMDTEKTGRIAKVLSEKSFETLAGGFRA